MRAIVLISFSVVVMQCGFALADNTVLPKTAMGLSDVIIKRIPRGMPISVARTKLAAMGFECHPGQRHSNFGPVGDATFIYCEYKAAGKVHAGVLDRWRVAVVFKDGKVTGTQAEYSPIYTKP